MSLLMVDDMLVEEEALVQQVEEVVVVEQVEEVVVVEEVEEEALVASRDAAPPPIIKALMQQ